MTELQIILLVCAVVFVGALYWWGKKNNQQHMQRPFTREAAELKASEQEDFDVIPVIKKPAFITETVTSEASVPIAPSESIAFNHAQETTAAVVAPTPHHADDDNALTSRMTYVDSTAHTVSAEKTHTTSESEHPTASDNDLPHATQSQLFALLILSPSRELSRKQIHAAMEASRLTFHNDGTYVHRDATGNIVFRVANVVEPGFFPDLEDEHFATPGIALVLELPASITPYRAMDEFITVARKVSQNLDGKLYDAQRHLIKESDLKAMREYAQSLTY